MRPRTYIFPILLALVASFSALSSAAEKKSKQSSDLKALMQKTSDAWDTLDAANAAPFYAKEADHVFYDMAPLKYTGWNEYAAGAKKLLDNMSSLKLTLGDDATVHQHGTLAWATATLRADVVTKGGLQESSVARWTVVWEKQGKDWLIVHEHVSMPAAPFPEGPVSLYKRLGGYDAIAAVTDDFIGRLVNDAQLSKFFAGHSTESLHHIRQLVVDQLCAATGGPCLYIGRDMKSAHAGLGISESDWNAAAGHLVETLDKFQVQAKEKDEVLSAISGMKKDIVEK